MHSPDHFCSLFEKFQVSHAYSSISLIDKFSLVMKLQRGGFFINGATPSSFHLFSTFSNFIQFLSHHVGNIGVHDEGYGLTFFFLFFLQALVPLLKLRRV